MAVPPAVVAPRLPAFIESLLRLEGSLSPAASAREGARYVVRPDLLEPSHQREVTLTNRLTVVHWIMLYCDQQMLRHNTFAAAVALLDLYLTANPHVEREVLQSVGGVALLVASKHHEYTGLDIPSIVDAVHALPGSEAGAASEEGALVARFFNLEVKLCNDLGWRTAPPTVVDWLDVMCLQVGMLADAAAAHHESIREGGGRARGRRGRPRDCGGGGAGAGAATPQPRFTLQVDAEAYLALLCCTADVRDGSEPDDELVGLPSVVRTPPCISDVPSWPVTLEADTPAFYNSHLASGAVRPISSRAPSKLLFDTLNVAAVMAMHAGHARWPPSVLACAAIAAVVAEYDSAAREARGAAGEREGAHAGAGVGASDADVLARFANLRPVVWALIRAWLPGRPVAEGSAGAGGGATRFPLPAAADLLSPPASRKRKREEAPDSAASAATASTSEGRAGGGEAARPWSTPWSALPSALSWVSDLASDLPLPGPHGDALPFVTDPDFVSLTVPREAATLKYVTTFAEAYRPHVLDKAAGAATPPATAAARTRAAFPEAFEEGRLGLGRERAAPLVRAVPTWTGAGAGEE